MSERNWPNDDGRVSRFVSEISSDVREAIDPNDSPREVSGFSLKILWGFFVFLF